MTSKHTIWPYFCKHDRQPQNDGERSAHLAVLSTGVRATQVEGCSSLQQAISEARSLKRAVFWLGGPAELPTPSSCLGRRRTSCAPFLALPLSRSRHKLGVERSKRRLHIGYSKQKVPYISSYMLITRNAPKSNAPPLAFRRQKRNESYETTITISKRKILLIRSSRK